LGLALTDGLGRALSFSWSGDVNDGGSDLPARWATGASLRRRNAKAWGNDAAEERRHV